MTDSKQKKPDERKSGINPVAAVVTGAVVGAGVAVAGVVALKDKKNREKVKGVLTNVKNQAIGYMKDIQKQARVKKDEVQEKLAEGKEKAEKVEKIVKE